MALYRNFATETDINKEYNAVLSVDDLAAYIEQDIVRSQETRRELPHFIGVQYGNTSEQTLDIFPSHDENSPVIMFIHGGYWRSLTSQDFSFVARGLVNSGFTVVLTNYNHCPKVTIPQITVQNRTALHWVYQHCSDYSGNPQKIFVAGHSAGAQQAAMLMLECNDGTNSLSNNVIKGCIGISGIYDLTPLMHSWLQPDLRLDKGTIADQSPLLQQNVKCAPALLLVGQDESTEFKRQSKDYADQLISEGNAAQFAEIASRNHFSVIQDLYDSNSQTSRIVKAFIEAW